MNTDLSPSEVVFSTSEGVQFISEINFPCSYPYSLAPRARTRVTTCKTLFFAFTAFTEFDNSLSMSRLSVKANPVKEVKDEVFLAFTHNSLMLCDLSHRVKA